MSFPLSSRFAENIVASPSPTAYNIPSTFNENGGRHASSWTRPASIGSHKCNENCCNDRICSRYSGDCHKKHVTSKSSKFRRLSLNTAFIASETTSGKDNHVARPRLSLPYNENIPSPQRKPGQSSIPRIKKSVTEGHAFSFVGRKGRIHNCYDKQHDQSSDLSQNTTQKTYIRQNNKNKSTDSIEQDSQNALNVSYTILPQIAEDFASDEKVLLHQDKEQITQANSKDLNITDDEKTGEVKCQVQDLKTPIREALNSMYFTPQSTGLLRKNTEELSSSTRSKKYYDIACKSDSQELKESGNKDEKVGSAIKTRDIFGISDCNFIFLIGEEFIDDDYDSYIEDLNGSKGHSQVLQNQELYEMTRYLVRLYLNQNHKASSSRATSSPLLPPNLATNLKRRLGKILNKRKRSKVATSQGANIWPQVEAIVKNAIEELKCEFRKEIHETTGQKLDSLISEIKTQIFNANESIDNICAKKTTDLLSQLENVALKL